MAQASDGSTQKRDSELLFQELFVLLGCTAHPILTGQTKTPDFEITCGPHRMLAEVKQITEGRRAERHEGNPPTFSLQDNDLGPNKCIERPLHAAATQLAKHDLCTGISARIICVDVCTPVGSAIIGLQLLCQLYGIRWFTISKNDSELRRRIRKSFNPFGAVGIRTTTYHGLRLQTRFTRGFSPASPRAFRARFPAILQPLWGWTLPMYSGTEAWFRRNTHVAAVLVYSDRGVCLRVNPMGSDLQRLRETTLYGRLKAAGAVLEISMLKSQPDCLVLDEEPLLDIPARAIERIQRRYQIKLKPEHADAQSCTHDGGEQCGYSSVPGFDCCASGLKLELINSSHDPSTYPYL